MKFENTDVWGFEHAIRGMRNPLNSWSRSDSEYVSGNICDSYYVIGDNDIGLAQRLIKGGSEHRKYLRQIFVSVDITAPMYLWSELDTYKVGTVANSTSKMHKLVTTPITKECFEMDDYKEFVVYDGLIDQYTKDMWEFVIGMCEELRLRYLETKDKKYWKELIRILPESWLQTRTWTANYEVIRNIVHQRTGHKLTEWQAFIDWAHTLPYADELIFYKGEKG